MRLSAPSNRRAKADPLVNKAVVTYVGIPYWHFNIGVIEPVFHDGRLDDIERPDLARTSGNRKHCRRLFRRG